jgi:hypothetical protein
MTLNQALYKRHASLPVKEDPFYLTANCRNTAPVHEKAYAFYKGEPVVSGGANPTLNGGVRLSKATTPRGAYR